MVETVNAQLAAAGQPGRAVPQGLEPGTELRAKVEANLPNGIVRLAADGAKIDLRVPAPLPLGSDVTVTVSGSKVQPAIQLTMATPQTTAQPSETAGVLLNGQAAAQPPPAAATGSAAARPAPVVSQFLQAEGILPGNTAMGGAAQSTAPAGTPPSGQLPPASPLAGSGAGAGASALQTAAAAPAPGTAQGGAGQGNVPLASRVSAGAPQAGAPQTGVSQAGVAGPGGTPSPSVPAPQHPPAQQGVLQSNIPQSGNPQSGVPQSGSSQASASPPGSQPAPAGSPNPAAVSGGGGIATGAGLGPQGPAQAPAGSQPATAAAPQSGAPAPHPVPQGAVGNMPGAGLSGPAAQTGAQAGAPPAPQGSGAAPGGAPAPQASTLSAQTGSLPGAPPARANQAAPLSSPAAAGAGGTASAPSTVAPPAGSPANAAANTATAQRAAGVYPPQPGAGGASPAPMAAGAAPTGTAATALQQAAATVRQPLAEQQAGLGTLFAQIGSMLPAQASGRISLPEPVQKAMQQILGLRLGGSGELSGKALQQAVAQSGQFREAALAGRPGAFSGNLPDLKTTLISFRSLLQHFGAEAKPLKPAHQPSIPSKAEAPQGQAQQGAQGMWAGASQKNLQSLLEETDAALARVRITQLVNSGMAGDDGRQATASRPMDMVVELPLALGQETAVLQMQIGRDGGGNQAEEDGEAGWRLRFALDLTATGPVEAAISLRGGGTYVSLWVDRKETLQLLSEARDMMEAAFADAGLDLQELRFVRGLPPKTAAGYGATVDRTS